MEFKVGDRVRYIGIGRLHDMIGIIQVIDHEQPHCYGVEFPGFTEGHDGYPKDDLPRICPEGLRSGWWCYMADLKPVPNGNLWYHKNKKESGKEMKFKVNDRIRYVGDNTILRNKCGVIAFIDKNNSDYPYAVAFNNFHLGHGCEADGIEHCPDGDGVWCAQDTLELVEADEKTQEEDFSNRSFIVATIKSESYEDLVHTILCVKDKDGDHLECSCTDYFLKRSYCKHIKRLISGKDAEKGNFVDSAYSITDKGINVLAIQRTYLDIPLIPNPC